MITHDAPLRQSNRPAERALRTPGRERERGGPVSQRRGPFATGR